MLGTPVLGAPSVTVSTIASCKVIKIANPSKRKNLFYSLFNNSSAESFSRLQLGKTSSHVQNFKSQFFFLQNCWLNKNFNSTKNMRFNVLYITVFFVPWLNGKKFSALLRPFAWFRALDRLFDPALQLWNIVFCLNNHSYSFCYYLTNKATNDDIVWIFRSSLEATNMGVRGGGQLGGGAVFSLFSPMTLMKIF